MLFRSLRYDACMKYTVSKQVDHNDAYYTVRWSPITKADRLAIRTSVPSMGGIAEMYWMDEHGKLNLYLLARSYYGGLRATLRAASDPLEEKDEKRRAMLERHDGKIYYRYTLVESQDDMADIFYFFMSMRAPGRDFDHSGRYDRIFLNEVDEGKLITV